MELGLRLILITIGILILGGVVWDYQRRKKQVRREREHWEDLDTRAEPTLENDLDGWDGKVQVYDEALDEPVSVGEVRIISRKQAKRPSPPPEERPHVEPRFEAPPQPEPLRREEPPQPPASPEPAPEPEELPQVTMEPADRAEPEPQPEPAKRRGLFGRQREPAEPEPPAGPEEVFALHVVAGATPFAGPDLLNTFGSCGLSHGQFDIFHYVPVGGGDPLFSVANMVKPGTFDPAAMDRFTSPGLALFMALPGPRDPRAAFESMLSVGRRLAEELGGELRDDRRSVLTGQTIQSYRDRIGEFERTHLNRH